MIEILSTTMWGLREISCLNEYLLLAAIPWHCTPAGVDACHEVALIRFNPEKAQHAALQNGEELSADVGISLSRALPDCPRPPESSSLTPAPPPSRGGTYRQSLTIKGWTHVSS